MQSKTEKRSFTEVTVVTTRLKGTVVTIFSKNLKIKNFFPPIVKIKKLWSKISKNDCLRFKQRETSEMF